MREAKLQSSVYNVNMAGRTPTAQPLTCNPENAGEINESTLSEIVRRVYESVQTINVETPKPEARPANQSVEEEMARRFCLPRRPTAGQGQGQTNGRFSSNTRPIKFNPQLNYGHGSGGKKRGKAKSGKPKEAASSNTINAKELVLLPYPTYNQVPRYEHKRKLQELGLIIDGFPLQKSWDENELRLKVFCVIQIIIDKKN